LAARRGIVGFQRPVLGILEVNSEFIEYARHFRTDGLRDLVKRVQELITDVRGIPAWGLGLNKQHLASSLMVAKQPPQANSPSAVGIEA
jgi:hypothetical protein